MNDYNKKFQNYYYRYLDFNGDENVVCSKNRDNKINIYHYPVIVAFYNNKIIYSISSKYYEELKSNLKKEDFKNYNDIIEFLKKYFNNKNENIAIQKMYRMVLMKEPDLEDSRVINVDEKIKTVYFNSFEHHNDLEYKENKWNKIKKLQYPKGIVEDKKIVSFGFVSNIDYSGANIVIQTKEKYQNKGYGKSIVKQISKDLLDNDILPIYWVNAENIPSIKLAKDIGFEKKSVEIVVKYRY